MTTETYDMVVRGLAVLRREEPDFSLTATIAFLTIATLPKGVTVATLDTMLEMEPGTMGRTMQQLMLRELVVRERDEIDRRTHRVCLSGRGRALASCVGAAMGVEA